jgi:hypothetical protein
LRDRIVLPRVALRRGEDGAIAVESALVLLVVALFTFGMIEFSLAYRDYSAVASSARLGVRTAASSPDSGTCSAATAMPGDNPVCSGQAPVFAISAANAIVRSGTGGLDESIREIMIYKANAAGFPGTLTSIPASCAALANCVEFKWNATSKRFRFASGSWNSKLINACFPNNQDSVGVNVTAEHQFLTGLFGSSITLSQRGVMAFEPLPTAICASGLHT